MGYAPQPFASFGNGLNLRDKADAVDPADAIDARNVEFTERGSVKQRGGTVALTSRRVNLATNPNGKSTSNWMISVEFVSATPPTTAGLPDGITDAFYYDSRIGGIGARLPFAVEEGKTYTVSAYGLVEHLGWGPFFEVVGQGVTVVTGGGQGVWDDTSFSRHSLTFTANSTGTYELVLNPAQASFWITAILIEESSAPRPYFDGDSVGASWDDSPDESTSTLGGEPSAPVNNLAPFYMSDGERQLVVGCDKELYVFTPQSALVASETGLSEGVWDFARFGAPGNEWIIAGNGSEELWYWDGSAWDQISGAPKAGALAVMAVSQGNRLVASRTKDFTTGGPGGDSANPSRVWFSDPGDPETWQPNNYVDFTPGDGEAIQALVAWREFVFVFKETKFFRIDGSTEDASGNPVFLYTTFDTGVGLAAPRAVVPTEHGVFFLSSRGVYVTTGGEPECVSDPVEPIFLGSPSPYYTGGVLNQSFIRNCAMGFWDNKVFLSFPTQVAPDRTLVFDVNDGWWSLYDFPATCFATLRIDGREDLVFGSGTIVHRHNDAIPNDNGSAIRSWWRSGWMDYGIPEQKTIRETKIWGVGTLELSIAVDWNTDRGDSSVVRLTSAVSTNWNESEWGAGEWVVSRSVTPALSRRAVRGTVFSTYFYHDKPDEPFAVHRAEHHLREQRTESKVTP